MEQTQDERRKAAKELLDISEGNFSLEELILLLAEECYQAAVELERAKKDIVALAGKNAELLAVN